VRSALDERVPWRDLLALGLLAALVLAAHALLTRPRLEPDESFHLAISRETAAHGLVRTVPQVVGLGWDKQFPEKEFLFHALTGAGAWAAGDDGARAMVVLMRIAAMGLLYLLCRRQAPPLLAWMAVVGLALSNGYYLFRLELMRPHVLAGLCAECLLWGLLSKRAWLSAVGAALFALAYHTLYIPLGLAVVAGAWSLWHRDGPLTRSALAAVAGLAAGLFANPYFPVNVLMVLTMSRIALRAHTAQALALGQELYPLDPASFFHWFGPALAAAGLGALFLWRGRAAKAPSGATGWLALCAAGLWALAALNPRAIEYAIPLTCVFVAHALASAPVVAGVALGATLVWNAVALRGFDAWDASDRFQAASARAVAALPPEVSGKNVLNCTFELGSFLLYSRPDVRFTDLSDPHFLLFHSPQLFEARERFKQGRVADPRAVAHDIFGADYVLCANPDATQMMDEDPRFLRLSPAPPQAIGADTGPGLFRVEAETPHPEQLEFVASRETRKVGAYLNLDAVSSDRGCLTLRVPAPEVARLAGSELVGLGGGPTLRLRWNDQPVGSAGPFSAPRVLQRFIELPRPLQAGDSLDISSCAEKDAPFWGAAASFWTRASLTAACTSRQRPVENCFAPGATPARTP